MNIAIVGSGISGLAASFLLNQKYNITLYEKNSYIGGHSRTVDVSEKSAAIPVDTGFIVFNKENYPNLWSLFELLGVEIYKSDMSFGVSIKDGWLEYGTKKLYNIFAQKKNFLRPKFLAMIGDILRFNKHSRSYIQKGPSYSVGQFLEDLKLGPWFRDYYLLAMAGAIWSQPIGEILHFPVSNLIKFFDNHGLLSVNDQHQWYTVKGGSREYVKKLTASFKNKINYNCGVKKILRSADKVTVIDSKNQSQQYDQVILACHSDQALNMLEQPSVDEYKVLSKINYQPNKVVLHSDHDFMPKNQSAWSSWVYLSNQIKDSSSYVKLSYWMNSLQSLPTKTNYILTLNAQSKPKDHLSHDQHQFEHPIFNEQAFAAQKEVLNIQGKNRVWFCGAWQGHGFHEDGLNSALRVAKYLGMDPLWS